MPEDAKSPEPKLDIKPGMTPEQMLDAVLSKDEIIPWETCVLPSLGIYYKDKDGKSLVPDGVVQIRAMGIYADKILATARFAKSGTSLDWLFRKCVKISGDLDPLDLLVGDRVFLLYYLRGITYGNDYDFFVTCSDPDCAKRSEQHYDLNDLVKTVIRPNSDIGDEPFKMILPYLSEYTGSEFWIKVRLVRGRDTQSMVMRRNVSNLMRPRSARAKSEPEAQLSVSGVNESIDDTVSQNLNLVITEVMGSKDRGKIEKLVEKMHSRDTAEIREFLRKNSPGIDTQVVVTCKHCDAEMTLDLPITESFFRPAERRGDRK